MAELSLISAALTSIRDTIVYGFELKAASLETDSVLRGLEIVLRDLNSFKIYAKEVWAKMGTREQIEVKQAIADVNEAMLQMAKPASASYRDIRNHGTVTIYRRVEWTLGGKATVRTHQPNLHLAHNSLVGLHNRLLTKYRDHASPEIIPTLTSADPSNIRQYYPSDGLHHRFWIDIIPDPVEDIPTSRLINAGSAVDHGGIDDTSIYAENARRNRENESRQSNASGRHSHPSSTVNVARSSSVSYHHPAVSIDHPSSSVSNADSQSDRCKDERKKRPRRRRHRPHP